MSGKRTDSVSITLADLNEAIKPLIEAMNRQREEQTSNNSQLAEMYQMMTSISVKLDVVEQKTNEASESSRTPLKKPVGRGKAAAKKAPAKKAPAKKVTTKKTNEEDEDVEEGSNYEEGEEEGEEPKKQSKKAPVKKAPVKKAPVKKAPVKKAPVKKVTTKKTTKTTVKPNIMAVFKLKFKENEKQFDKWITAKVKKEMEAEYKDVWDGLDGDDLINKRVAVYYAYMRENHKDVLEEFKEKYVKDAEESEENEDAEAVEEDAEAVEEDTEAVEEDAADDE